MSIALFPRCEKRRWEAVTTMRGRCGSPQGPASEAEAQRKEDKAS